MYIIQSIKSDRYYIGSTINVEKRLREHNYGKVRSTRKRGPWIIKLTERLPSKQEAIKREMQIKRYKGGEAFKRLIR